mgnify:CR=1 FL=1
MENNFNLKKFLVENKLTTNSRVLKEGLASNATQEYLHADSNGVSIAEFVKAIIDGAAEFNQDEAMYYDLDPASQSILKAIGREDLIGSTNSKAIKENESINLSNTAKGEIANAIETWIPEDVKMTSDHLGETITQALEGEGIELPEGMFNSNMHNALLSLSTEFHSKQLPIGTAIEKAIAIATNPENYS